MKALADPEGPNFLRLLFEQAVAAVHPDRIMAQSLPDLPSGRVIILGAGKASAAMAAAVERAWPDASIEGLVVTRYGHSVPCARVRVIEASHPVPDGASIAAAQDMLQLAATAKEGDLVLCLMSGGGSALMVLPEVGLSLADKQDLARQLLKSGAPIQDINRVRIAVSAIKGGKLTRAALPARVHTIVISDIPGDDPALVASGPSIPTHVAVEEVRAIFERWAIQPPAAVDRYLSEHRTVDAGVDAGAAVSVTVAATAKMMLDAAADVATAAGASVEILDECLEGEARDVAQAMAAQIREGLRGGAGEAPRVLLSGGETSVTKRGEGRGGRNGEFLLALCLALEGVEGYQAIACDTDGIDGSEDNAGAVADATTLDRARKLGLDPARFLADNDSYGFFQALGDLVMTGPTRTNVNDFRAVLLR